jgi:hypothetical protein
MGLMWWGYLHINGSIQVKRAFNHPSLMERDFDEAIESPFVSQVFKTFEANSREEAIAHIQKQLG